jgi:hypothetical protein
VINGQIENLKIKKNLSRNEIHEDPRELLRKHELTRPSFFQDQVGHDVYGTQADALRATGLDQAGDDIYGTKANALSAQSRQSQKKDPAGNNLYDNLSGVFGEEASGLSLTSLPSGQSIAGKKRKRKRPRSKKNTKKKSSKVKDQSTRRTRRTRRTRK